MENSGSNSSYNSEEMMRKRKLMSYGDLWTEDQSSSEEEEGELRPQKISKISSESKDKENKEHREKDKRRDKDNDKMKDLKKEKDKKKEREKQIERERQRAKDKQQEAIAKDRERARVEREREKERRERKERRDRSSPLNNRKARDNKRDEREHREREEDRKQKEEAERKLKEEMERKRKEEEEYKKRVAQQMQVLEIEEQEIDEEEEARQRRKRREAILQKFKEQGETEEAKKKKSAEKEKEVKESDEEENVQSPTRDHDVEWVGKEDLRETTKGESEGTEEGVSKSPADAKEAVDDFDMFSDSPIALVKRVPKKPAQMMSANVTEITDDAEGYYCYRIGEALNERYIVKGSYGKGVFSTVLRATDTLSDREVAIKILRNNDAMKRMGHKEIQLLLQLGSTDPHNKYNCIRLLNSFTDRDHLCLVFEAMRGGNLRDVLKKYGTKIGLSISAVKIYATKIFLALKLLKKCKILHADIKLDNILVNETKTSIKLGDFGSASAITENTITPYLVSRFYRAPEIVMGMQYSYPIDMWSVGCCLYEIFTGKILFPGKSNNDLLYYFMEVAGPFNKRLLKKGQFANMHFEENGEFKRVMVDKITGKDYVKVYRFQKPTRDLKKELLNSTYELSVDEERMITQLHDLLSKIFVLDPSNRMTVEEALRHPFISGHA